MARQNEWQKKGAKKKRIFFLKGTPKQKKCRSMPFKKKAPFIRYSLPPSFFSNNPIGLSPVISSHYKISLPPLFSQIISYPSVLVFLPLLNGTTKVNGWPPFFPKKLGFTNTIFQIFVWNHQGEVVIRSRFHITQITPLENW